MMGYLGEKIIIKLTFPNFYQLWNGSFFFIKVGPDSMLQELYGYELY